MTSVHHQECAGYRAIRWNMDWITRPLFGLALAAVAIGVLFSAPPFFAALVVAISIAAAWEWHRMVSKGRLYHTEAAVDAVTVALAVTSLLMTRQAWIALIVLAVGAGVAWKLAQKRHVHPVWQAVGMLYLGLPALALVGLRAFEPRGAMVIVGMFLIVWATDIGRADLRQFDRRPAHGAGAFAVQDLGRHHRRQRYRGLGLRCLYLRFPGRLALAGAAVRLCFSVTAHAGDLFESFVKRRFGVKNSGAMIPGHGGVLDRMDSTLGCRVADGAFGVCWRISIPCSGSRA